MPTTTTSVTTPRTFSNANVLDEIRSRFGIEAAARALGVGLKGNRFVVAWRKGKHLSGSINLESDTFFDHVVNEGGGLLRFVELAGGFTKSEALQWLAEQSGVPLRDQSVAERKEWARRRRAAEREAAEIEEWRADRIRSLQEERNHYLAMYHRTLRLILRHSLNHPHSSIWADAHEIAEERFHELDLVLDTMRKPADWRALVAEFRGSYEAAA